MSFSIRLLLPALAVIAACAKDAPPPPARVPVTISTAERRAVPYELLATGTVEPIQTVAVQAQVSGPIVRIAFREGQNVKRGQVLFELDARPFRAALQQAQALLGRDRATAENAEQEAKRYAALAEKEYVTAQQNDAARTTAAASSATVASSQAAVDQARLNLQYATIRAPIDGRTGSLRVREGNLVRSTDALPLVTINQIQPILVRFAVPASNLGAIQKYRAQRIAVMAEAVGGGPSSEGTLAFVDNAVDTATGTVLLKATFPNTDGALWPGAFVNVRLRLYVDENALVVPAAAVVSGQQGSFVFVIQPDSSAATRSVKVDRTAGDLAIVSGEVRAGDRVVVDGQLRLRQGIKVQIKASGDSAQARAS
ncbi:MAG TPA: efflux RND transporter periplasmic adaptor subunit [Gemmatimonadales bacterium]|nr:efflux RND transporter periplasmic adaptor subunit [Gemmatimonadales bacterium]